MKIILAPDSFKGSCSSVQVCRAMEKGIRQVMPEAEVIQIPMADGGEGSVEAVIAATGGHIKKINVRDPLGRLVEAFYGISGDESTAIIEMAAASGLPLLTKEELNPLITSTYGTGQLILDAINEGVRKIILGIGGSATNDGGMGMAKALGVRFLDSSGIEIGEGGMELTKLAKIDMTGLDGRVAATEFLVACDVTNPLTGPFGAARVYGPQKGASESMIIDLDRGLKRFAEVIRTQMGLEINDLAGAGAAGGMGGGVTALLNGQLTSGVQLIIEATGLREKIRGAVIGFTGEGRLDSQSALGKTMSGVGRVAQEMGVPMIAIVGSLGEGYQSIYETGVVSAVSIVNGIMTLDEAMADSERLITDAVSRSLRIFLAGGNMRS